MTFKFASVEVIKSASQRALAFYWDQLAAGRRFPALSELKPEPGLHDPRQLVVWNVEGEGPRQKFRAMYQGDNVAEAFNAAWAGKTMDQVVPMSLRHVTLEAAKECVGSGCLVYTTFSTIDASDQRVDCERLLLPFGQNGKVEQMLGSLQLSVPKARPRVLKHFQMQTDVLLEARIRSGFAAAQPAAGASGAGPKNMRRAARRNVRKPAKISFAGRAMSCMVRNISATGASIEAANLAVIPDQFKMVLEMEASERRCTVVWRKKTQLGVAFG